jgi:hypothetical protein
MTDFRALCAELADSLEDWLSSNSIGGISLDDGTDVELINRARTVLAQREPQGPTGRPAIEPVPVAERLPGPEDCDAEGRCWLLTVDDDYPQWRLHSIQGAQSGGYMIWVPVDSDGAMVDCFYTSHWLPAHALPVPQQEADLG